MTGDDDGTPQRADRARQIAEEIRRAVGETDPVLPSDEDLRILALAYLEATADRPPPPVYVTRTAAAAFSAGVVSAIGRRLDDDAAG